MQSSHDPLCLPARAGGDSESSRRASLQLRDAASESPALPPAARSRCAIHAAPLRDPRSSASAAWATSSSTYRDHRRPGDGWTRPV